MVIYLYYKGNTHGLVLTNTDFPFCNMGVSKREVMAKC